MNIIRRESGVNNGNQIRVTCNLNPVILYKDVTPEKAKEIMLRILRRISRFNSVVSGSSISYMKETGEGYKWIEFSML